MTTDKPITLTKPDRASPAPHWILDTPPFLRERALRAALRAKTFAADSADHVAEDDLAAACEAAAVAFEEAIRNRRQVRAGLTILGGSQGEPFPGSLAVAERLEKLRRHPDHHDLIVSCREDEFALIRAIAWLQTPEGYGLAQLEAAALRARLEDLDGTACVVCGCTENHACGEGCAWDTRPAHLEALGDEIAAGPVCTSCTLALAQDSDTRAAIAKVRREVIGTDHGLPRIDRLRLARTPWRGEATRLWALIVALFPERMKGALRALYDADRDVLICEYRMGGNPDRDPRVDVSLEGVINGSGPDEAPFKANAAHRSLRVQIDAARRGEA